MTDQTKPAVAALAEAMANCWGGIANDLTRINARYALQAIRANPDILREYGIGRLPTRKDLDNLPYKERGTSVTLGEFNIALMIEAGWCLPDPQPPEPTLREQVAAMIQAGMDNGQYPDAIMRSLLAEFDITPKAAAEGDVSCG